MRYLRVPTLQPEYVSSANQSLAGILNYFDLQATTKLQADISGIETELVSSPAFRLSSSTFVSISFNRPALILQ